MSHLRRFAPANIVRFIYYKYRQFAHFVRLSIETIPHIKSGYLTSHITLKDGTDISLTRTYYDYMMFHENFVEAIYVKYLPPNFNPKVILDLGAHKGFFSVPMARKFPEATIYAIEPNTENYAYLLRNIKPYKNIIPRKAAIWNTKTKLPLFVSKKHSGGHSFIQARKTASELVDTLTFADLPKADFIKCDIEGSEHVLEFDAPYLVFETHDVALGNQQTLKASLEKKGYSIITEGAMMYAHL